MIEVYFCPRNNSGLMYVKDDTILWSHYHEGFKFFNPHQKIEQLKAGRLKIMEITE